MTLLIRNPNVYARGNRLLPCASGHPLVKELYNIIVEQEAHIKILEKTSGAGTGTLRHWFRKNRTPNLFLFNDVANTLGYDVKLVKRTEETT